MSVATRLPYYPLVFGTASPTPPLHAKQENAQVSFPYQEAYQYQQQALQSTLSDPVFLSKPNLLFEKNAMSWQEMRSSRVRRQTTVDTPLVQAPTSSSIAPASEARPVLSTINVAKALSALRESCNDTISKRWEKYDDFVLYLVRQYRFIADPLSASDLTPGLRKKAVALFVAQILKEKSIAWQQELGPDPKNATAIYYDGLMFRHASGKPISVLTADLDTRIQRVLIKHGLGDIPGLSREILPLLTTDPTVSLFPRTTIAYGSAQWVKLWTGISLLTEQGLDPSSYTEAQLMDVGQAALIEQGEQSKVGIGNLLLMAHAAGALDIRTLNPNNKQVIHDQLMTFIKTAFAEDFQIIEALTTLAQTPYPTRRQVAEDNLRAAGIRPSKKNVDLYMEADQLSSLLYREILDNMIQKDALAAAELRPHQNEKSLRQAREKLRTQSLKEEFNTKFNQYEKVVSEQTTKLINASLSRYSKRHGIDLSAASITVSQIQQTVSLKKTIPLGVSNVDVVSLSTHNALTDDFSSPLKQRKSEGYLIDIDTPAGKHQYFFSFASKKEIPLPPGSNISAWSKENEQLVFGSKASSGIQFKPERLSIVESIRPFTQPAKQQEMANLVKAALPTRLKPLREQAYGQLLAEEVVEDLERMIIPFHATYSAIRNGENIGTILLDAGLDALIFLPAIGAGISLSARTGLLAAEIMLEEMEGLSEKGLLQAMKQGSARLAALSPEWVGEGSKVLTLAAENALWLPQDILSLLRGTRRWTAWGMRSLLQSLEKTNPNLAQKLSQAFTKAASRLGEDGKSWRLSEDLLKAPPKINPAVTLSESKIATAEASIKVLPTPYVKASTADGASQILQRVDENNYLEVNPQTLAPEGSLLVADAQGSLRPLLLTDAVEKFKVQDQTVITQLTAQSEPEDHVYRLGNKCYAKISDQFVEIVPNSRATLFWRINDPILFGSASADYVMPSMIWDNESQQWQQMAAPRLLGGGNFSSRFGNKPEFETGSSGFEKVPDNVIERIAAFYEEDEGTILSLSLVNKRFHRLLEPHRDYLELSKEIKNLHHDNISYFFPSLSFLINFKKITARIGEKFRGIQREKLLVKLSEKIPIRTEHGFFHPVTYITFSGGYIRDWLRAVAQWRQSPKSLNYKEWVRLENRVKACQYFVDNPDAMWGIQEVLPFTTPGFKVTHGWFISIAKSKDGFETLKVLSENVDALLLMLSGDDRSQRMVDRVLEIARDGGSDDLQALFTRYRAAKNL